MKSFAVCGIFLIIVNIVNSQKGSTSTYNLCPSNVLLVEGSLNGPPGRRNIWMGTLLLHEWPDLRNVDLQITLDHQAKLSLLDSSRNGEVFSSGSNYEIKFNQPISVIKEIKFLVQGKPNKGFPSPTSIKLNGIEICFTGDNFGPTTNEPAITNKDSDENLVQGCGRRMIHHQGLVTNGYPSQEGEWPWHAALYLRKGDSMTYICGGTLVSSEMVLTASHCVIEGGHSVIPSRLVVKLALHNRAVASSNTEEFPVYEIITHEKFDPIVLKNDIALLRLSHRVRFNYYIQPVCLWPKESIGLDNIIGVTGVVVGWGFTEKNELSDILTQGRMPAVSTTDCLESNRDFFGHVLTDSNFCAGYRNGTSACNGDSGGGLVFEKDKTFYLRGVVSLAVAQFDKAVCNSKEYVVFTDVAKFIDWIELKMTK